MNIFKTVHHVDMVTHVSWACLHCRSFKTQVYSHISFFYTVNKLNFNQSTLYGSKRSTSKFSFTAYKFNTYSNSSANVLQMWHYSVSHLLCLIYTIFRSHVIHKNKLFQTTTYNELRKKICSEGLPLTCIPAASLSCFYVAMNVKSLSPAAQNHVHSHDDIYKLFCQLIKFSFLS